MSDKLTVVLPLKDRVQYTHRFLSDLNEKKCPFKILIADGGTDSNIQKDLEDKKNYPNVNYEYIRYDVDNDLPQFFNKMKEVTERVETKYVTLQDNDDYFDIEGMNKSVEILDKKNYYSARGMVTHIPGGHNMYAEYPDPITGSTSAERVFNQTRYFHSNWHNVMYSDILKTTWSLIDLTQPNNFRFVEQINCYVPIAIGDGHRGDFPWMTHICGDRINTNTGSLQDHFPDQMTWIMSSHWLDNFNKMTEIVGCLIAKYDVISVERGMQAFREAYPLKLPHLKDVLNNRINQAKNKGYDYNRISNICKIIDKWRL